MLIRQANELHHRLIAPFVREDDLVVDCTLGNGHDALFLARTIAGRGHLFGFDVQVEAVERTRMRLLEADIAEDRFTLVLGSHALVAEHVPQGIGAAMYNLGYLPGGDRGIATDLETTATSIGETLGLLRRGGVAGIMLYYGHEGGRDEAEGVLDYVSALDRNHFTSLQLRYLNLPNAPPSLVLIQRAP